MGNSAVGRLDVFRANIAVRSAGCKAKGAFFGLCGPAASSDRFRPVGSQAVPIAGRDTLFYTKSRKGFFRVSGWRGELDPRPRNGANKC